MKSKVIFSRYRLLWASICFYMLPIVLLILYKAMSENKGNDWLFLSSGIFLAAFGSLGLFLMMTKWETGLTISPIREIEIKHPETPTEDHSSIDPEEYNITKLSLEEAQKAQIRLLEEIDILSEELRQTSTAKKQDQQQIGKIKEELAQLQQTSSQHLEHQQRQIRELQGDIVEQKNLVEQKQQEIVHLEKKVGDLTHEIKTLLHFAESHLESSRALTTTREPAVPTISIETPQEKPPSQPNQSTSIQLKRCLDIAQKIMGSQRFGSQLYSFMESPADSYSLDLRRLCDRLRGESGTILLYSPKENLLLFASNRIKEQTGWSPEKFVQNFSDILHDVSLWNQGIADLRTHSETKAYLSIKTRSGQPLSLETHLGMIPSGIFRNYVIGVID
ncbi:MAG: hypothetical protein WCG42_08970 [Parachlamydiaceae bacterium]